MKPHVESRLFGELANGEPVMEFTLDNGRGMLLSVLDYACIIRSWRSLGRHGPPVDFVLGFDTLLEYERDPACLGQVLGRPSFQRTSWQAHLSADEELARLSLCKLCKDGEDGMRGNLMVMVTYELCANGELRCYFQACADQATPLDISQRNYFNLAGEGDVLGHELCIDAGAASPVDFRLPRRIGASSLAEGPGYDLRFMLGPVPGPKACLSDPAAGRRMDVHTSCPVLRLYRDDKLDGNGAGKGRQFTPHAGLCLEPRQSPDAICQPGKPFGAMTSFAPDRWR